MSKRPRPIEKSSSPSETPVVWIEQRKDGVSYGVRGYGKGLKDVGKRVRAVFLETKRFVDVELPEREAAQRKAQLAQSAERLREDTA